MDNVAIAEVSAEPGQSERLIPLPEPGQVIVVDLRGLESAKFAFDPDAAQTTVRGNDLVLSVNGGEIVLVGYLEELRLGELPTIISPLGEAIFPDALLNRPGGQEPDQSETSGPRVPESAGGFAPSEEATPLGAPNQPAGALAATSLDYSGLHSPAPLEPIAFEPLPPTAIVPPIAENDSAVTDEDTPVTIAVLANDSAAPGLSLTVETAHAGNGQVVVNPDNTLTYEPAPDFNGTDTITYTVNDGRGGTATATVTVTVQPVNDPPLAVDDTAATNEDEPVTIAVLGNDSDLDGDKLTVTAASTQSGTVAINPDGTLTYTPAPDFNGTGTIVYTIEDGKGGTDSATVTVTVNPVNDPPIAKDDSATVAEDTPVTGAVLANDSDTDGDPLTATLVDGPSNGTLVLNADGTFTYAPNPDFSGSDSFTYKANDGAADSNLATVVITINPVNDPPVAKDDSASTAEDTPVTGAVLGNDSDVDGDTLTATLVGGPSNGSLVLNTDGTYTYTPDADFNGTDSFTYVANDGTTDSNLATVVITVSPVNDAPVAKNDSVTGAEDTLVTGAVLTNDGDVDGDPLTATLVDGPSNGTLVLNTDGTFTYTPKPNFSGADSFTYVANDGTADSNVATVAITVTPVNDLPVAEDDTATTAEDTPVTGGVLGNDSDVDGDKLTATVVDGPSNGTLVLDSDGTYTYTPDPDFNGTDSFTYLANDGTDDSNLATVVITVEPVNDPPVAKDDSATGSEDKAIAGAVLGNDSDADGDKLTAILVDGPSNGTLLLGPNGGFVYQPNPDFNGTDSFTYKANDGTADSNIATVFLTVRPVNDPPVAKDDSATGPEDTPVTGAVLANDTDVDGDKLTAALVDGPSNGTLVLNADGTFTYTPDQDFNGSDSFTYIASDGAADSNLATVFLTIDPVNDPPIARDDRAATTEDTPLTGSVLTNDSDVDGDKLTASLVDGPSNGTVVQNFDGSFTYTPNANFNGTDSFTYKANDGTVDSNIATVTITVGGKNDAPVAADDAFATDEDTALNGAVLANDSDADGDTLTAALVGGPSNGTLVFNADGTFAYTPDKDFNGTDSFTYVASDGTADSNLATVVITVDPVNDPPIARDDHATTTEDTPVTGSVLANDSDADGDTLTVTLVDNPSHGTVVQNPDGTLTYTPDPDFNGTDSFTYKANDGTADSNIATVTISVGAENDAPVAVNDSFVTKEDSAVSGGVLGNDSDVDGDKLTVSLGSNPTHGQLVLNADGTFTYTPDKDFNGTDSFTYVANDGTADSNLATVVITVDPVNDPPIARDDHATTTEDTPVTGSVLANDSDADGDKLTVTLVGNPSHGTVVQNPDGTLTYTPDPDFNGTDSFTYKANDGTADSNIATVTIDVGAANDAPVAVDDAVATKEDVAVSGSVLGNDSDVDGDKLTASIASGPVNGQLLFNADGTFTYTPGPNFNGTDSFTYVANDGTADSNIATVRITVSPVNDPPIARDDLVTTAEDSPVTGAVLANDSDIDGDKLTALLATGPAHGKLLFNPDGTFTYTPEANFSGVDSFTYNASDGTDSDLATVTIVVDPVPDPPILVLSPAKGAEDQAIPLTISAVPTDPDEQLTITIAGVPAGALLSAGTKNPDGSWTLSPAQLAGLTVTPPLNSSNDFTLTVTATSQEPARSGAGATASQTGTLAVTVAPIADQPVFTVGSSVVITAPNQTINGTQGNDALVGGLGSDNITGLEGNDLLIGDPASGAQNAPLNIVASVTDTDGSEALEIDISKLPDGVTLSAGTQNKDGSWTLTPTQLAGLQVIVPSGTAPFDMAVTAVVTDRGPDDIVPDTLSTTKSIHVAVNAIPDDTLSGGSGADTLLGVAGNDSIQGGPGADVLDGGTGVDLIRDDDGAVARGGDGNDTLDIIYNSVFAAVQLEGGAGNDTITIQLNNNPDLGINGGVQFFADSSDPTAPAGDDVVTLKGSFTNGTAGNAGIFLGGGNDLFTNQAQSTIRVDGGAGNDTLLGSPVADSMAGGDGDDVITGGGGNGNDSLDGGRGNDSITGGLGLEVLTGGDGDDTIFGSQGADTITPGGGHDLLLYKDILDGADNIVAFDKTAGGASQDVINLDALFDSRGIATAQRAGLVTFVDVGSDVQLHVNVGFDVLVLTFKGMPDTTGLSVGNAATDDVQVGSL